MIAVANHTIEPDRRRLRTAAFGFGVDSASQEARRVVLFPYLSMDDRTAAAVHTPGPWAACREQFMFSGIPYIAGENGHGIILAQIQHTGKGNYEGQLGSPMADALLMAAAPELLEVCQGMIDLLYTDKRGIEQIDLGQYEERMRACVAAINKATQGDA